MTSSRRCTLLKWYCQQQLVRCTAAPTQSLSKYLTSVHCSQRHCLIKISVRFFTVCVLGCSLTTSERSSQTQGDFARLWSIWKGSKENENRPSLLLSTEQNRHVEFTWHHTDLLFVNDGAYMRVYLASFAKLAPAAIISNWGPVEQVLIPASNIADFIWSEVLLYHSNEDKIGDQR